jgi:hypothetical protein
MKTIRSASSIDKNYSPLVRDEHVQSSKVLRTIGCPHHVEVADPSSSAQPRLLRSTAA